MRFHCPPTLVSLLLSLALLAPSASAQETVIQVENVRMDYARVLRVEPVYQTLTASRMEQRCESRPTPTKAPAKGLSKIVGKVRNALDAGDGEADAAHADVAVECRMVPVQREFRRPIAFDVDYMYKGMKYRSRLAEDPGNRLRVRVSVTPAPSGR
jgi:uncharacterized protein YcfJ